MLRDDHSECVWFFVCLAAIAEYAKTALVDRCAAFPVPREQNFKSPTHFVARRCSKPSGPYKHLVITRLVIVFGRAGKLNVSEKDEFRYFELYYVC